jgi:alginate O-acetyltransferase complex protein AlgI
MDTASIQFVLFGLAAAILSNLSRSRVWRSIVLLSTSFIFLGLLAHYPIVFLQLAAFLLAGYGALAVLEHGWSKHAVWSILAVIFTHG